MCVCARARARVCGMCKCARACYTETGEEEERERERAREGERQGRWGGDFGGGDSQCDAVRVSRLYNAAKCGGVLEIRNSRSYRNIGVVDDSNIVKSQPGAMRCEYHGCITRRNAVKCAARMNAVKCTHECCECIRPYLFMVLRGGRRRNAQHAWWCGVTQCGEM